MSGIPWDELDTIFFDVGNTLVSIDFEWIRVELTRRGVECTTGELRRAEAAARPAVSAGIAKRADKETQDAFTFYFGLVLSHLPAAGARGPGGVAELARELTPVLRGPGKTARLWSWVLPGVRDALAALQQTGLQLAVVSNSDGSVETSLRDQGLRDYFDRVFDSHLVGHEKPDPRIFEAALELCGARPERTLHVGDLYAADVVGARSAGVHPVLLDPFDDWGEVDCVTLPDLTHLARRVVTARSGGAPSKQRREPRTQQERTNR